MFKTDKSPSVKVAETSLPTIFISELAINKMKAYIAGCNDEIGWLGTAIKTGKDYYIEDTFLFRQETHSTTTEITPQGLTEFAEEIMQQPNGMEIWNSLAVWGHSHVNMSTSPSGQDDSQMHEFKDISDFFIRIIANKKDDIKIDLYDFSAGIIYSDLRYKEIFSAEHLEIIRQIEELEEQLYTSRQGKFTSIKELVENEIKELVTKKTYSAPKYGSGYKSEVIPYNAKKTNAEEELEAQGWTKKEDGTWTKTTPMKNHYPFHDDEEIDLFNYDEYYGFNEQATELILSQEDVEKFIDTDTLFEVAISCKTIEDVVLKLPEEGYYNYTLRECSIIFQYIDEVFLPSLEEEASFTKKNIN